MLYVKNHPYKPAGAEGDLLGLQPIVDAIGLRYGLGVTLARSMVLVEGITDLIYLRAMNLVLKIADDLAVAPARGDSNVMTLIPFFIGQGIGFKLVIDAGGLRKKIQESYEMPDEFVFEIPIPNEFQAHTRSSGMEDLFSRDDFLRIAAAAKIDLGDSRKIERLSNSALVRKHPGKRIIAHHLLSCSAGIDFDGETEGNFRRVLEFCKGSSWFVL